MQMLQVNKTSLAYPGNIGFVEMMQFMDKANKKEQEEMDKAIKNEDWNSFKFLISKVLGTHLK